MSSSSVAEHPGTLGQRDSCVAPAQCRPFAWTYDHTSSASLLCFSAAVVLGTPVSPPPRVRIHRTAAPLSSSSPAMPRSGSRRQPSPVRLEEALTQTQEQITQLTNFVQALAAVHAVPPVAAAAAPPVAPAQIQGPPEDPTFDWTRLRQPVETSFPPATVGAVQRLCAGLLAKLSSLTGRDHHEVAFLLSMAADYPDMEVETRNITYQHLNLLYIATHHGWHAAIAASSATSGSVAILPPGFEIAQHARQPTRGRRGATYAYAQPVQQQQQQPQQQQQQNRGRGRRGGQQRGRATRQDFVYFVSCL